MSDTRVIVSDGKAWTVVLPKNHDLSWTHADSWTYAAAYVSGILQGFSEEKAGKVAEAIVHTRMYPGIEFNKELEADCKLVYC